jgi:hypothetical protein
MVKGSSKLGAPVVQRIMKLIEFGHSIHSEPMKRLSKCEEPTNGSFLEIQGCGSGQCRDER